MRAFCLCYFFYTFSNYGQQWENRLYEILAFLDREAYQNIMPQYVLPLITFRKKLERYYCKNAFLICFCQKPFVKLAMCLLPIRLDVAQQCLPFAAVIGGGGGGREAENLDEGDGKGYILLKNCNIRNLSKFGAFFLAYYAWMILI